MSLSDPPVRVRLDRFLWAARFFKTRSLAAAAVESGRAEVNGERAKRAKMVQAGDMIRLRLGPFVHELVVRAVSERRGPAPAAALLYEETADSVTARASLALKLRLSGALASSEKGRPSKKERRALERLRERDGDA